MDRYVERRRSESRALGRADVPVDRAGGAAIHEDRVEVDRWWIGGSPCSGKSTVAGMLAASWQLPLYRCDDAFARHARLVDSATGPTLTKVTAMPIGDRLAQPIEVQVGDVVHAYREEFPLIVQDLAGVGPILVEGAALLPDLLAGLNVARNRAVWIVPTEDFQRHCYRHRQWARDLLASLVDADGAFERWMRRDAVFARRVAEQASRLGYPVVTVGGTAEPADVAAAVEDLLDLSRTRRDVVLAGTRRALTAALTSRTAGGRPP